MPTLENALFGQDKVDLANESHQRLVALFDALLEFLHANGIIDLLFCNIELNLLFNKAVGNLDNCRTFDGQKHVAHFRILLQKPSHGLPHYVNHFHLALFPSTKLLLELVLHNQNGVEELFDFRNYEHVCQLFFQEFQN